jgi:hypothetical protein
MIAVRMLRSGLLAATLLCLAAASASGSEEDVAARPENAPAWDQQKATSAAESLATSLDGLRTALRQQPSMTLAPGTGSRSIHRLRDRLRLMESESKQLAQQLGEGRGRDETLPIFERINLIRRDAVEQAQRMFLQKPVMDQIESARGSLKELAGLYGVEFDRQLQIR